jgi:hypothetical protein
MSTPNKSNRPIIIVTGANKYVRSIPLRHVYHSAHSVQSPPRNQRRRLRNLSLQLYPNQLDDARPLFPPRSGDTDDDDERGLEYPCAGLTLIMACRSRQRAEAARAQVLQLFEHDVAWSMREGAPSSEGRRAHRGFSRGPRRCDPRARLGFRAEHLAFASKWRARESLNISFPLFLPTVGDGVLSCLRTVHA